MAIVSVLLVLLAVEQLILFGVDELLELEIGYSSGLQNPLVILQDLGFIDLVFF